MLKVLLVGHVCCPGLGSEPGVTWQWATHLAAHNEVWVLCHPQYREPTEAYLADHPVPRLHFHYVNLPTWRDPWDPAKGGGLRLQFHYLLWQHEVLRQARILHTRERFDVAHQVSWTTVTAASPLWKLPIPAVWGPVGGAITAPSEFLHYFGSAHWAERLRTLRVRLLPRSPAIRRAARNLTVTYATNLETMAFLRRAGARDVRFLIDCGLLGDTCAGSAPPPDTGRLELLWAGRLEGRKALPIVIEAVAQLPADFPVRIRVAGGGPLETEWKDLARRLGVADRFEFIGLIPGEQMNALIDDAQALLFSSLRDAFGTVVLEAMTRGRPVLALDHQGFGSAVPSDAAIKIPVTTPAATVRAYAEGIRQLADAEVRHRLVERARAFMLTQRWTDRAELMTVCYRQVCAERAAGERHQPTIAGQAFARQGSARETD
jgi:glycosyltransferase involved in cell wall biosynthesis